MILVDLARVAASRPGKPLFAELSLTVSSGDRLGIVGLNGTGKSTLLRVLTGAAEPESGTVRRGRGVRVAALDQVPRLPPGRVVDAVGSGWEAAAVLDRLGMGELLDADVATLSGGQAKRVALARTLVAECDLLVLDEPTNHLDIDAIAWLEERLAGFRGGLVLVTHDRHVLDRVTTRVLELDRGRGYVHEGGYAAYLEGRARRDEQAADAESTRRNLARKELAWLRRGAPARTRKPKARIESATALVEGRAEAPARVGLPDLHLGTPRLGDKVVELAGVGHRFDGGPTLFSGVDLALDRRERLGVVGPNGAGKSTLLDVVAGRIEPAEGHVEVGSTVRLGYYDQLGVELDPTRRVREALAGDARAPDWRDAALLEQFWFSDDAQWAPIGLLSGGERRRLQLLLTLAAQPNVLLLDEPTNDLDLDTLRVLEEFLDDWPGALVVVSHDRAFLERTVTDVVVVDGSGGAGRRPGGYAAWEDDRRARRRPAKARSVAAGAGSRSAAAPAASTGRPARPLASPRRRRRARPARCATCSSRPTRSWPRWAGAASGSSGSWPRPARITTSWPGWVPSWPRWPTRWRRPRTAGSSCQRRPTPPRAGEAAAALRHLLSVLAPVAARNPRRSRGQNGVGRVGGWAGARTGFGGVRQNEAGAARPSGTIAAVIARRPAGSPGGVVAEQVTRDERVEEASDDDAPWRWWRPALVFLAVAAVVWLVALVASETLPREYLFPRSAHDRGGPLVEMWVRWDAGWYREIVRHGYRYDPGVQSSVAYFPAYPLAMAALAWALPSIPTAGVVVTFASGLGSAVLFHRWCSERLSPRVAMTALLVLLVWPFSWYLFGAVYSDAFFLVVVLAAFLLVERRRYWLAGAVGFLACASRPTGIAVAIGLVLVVLEQQAVGSARPVPLPAATWWGTAAARLRWFGRELVRRFDVRRLRHQGAPVLISFGGLAAWMTYLWVRFDDPLLFVHIEATWWQGAGPRTWAKLEFFHQLPNVGHQIFSATLVLHAVAGLGALVLVVPVARRFGWAYGGYVLAVMAIPVIGTKDFMSCGRYLLAAFPVFALVGAWLAERPSPALAAGLAGRLVDDAAGGHGHVDHGQVPVVTAAGAAG